MGLPSSVPEAVDLALTGSEVRPLDAIRIAVGEDDMLMIQSAAFGLPAEVARRYDRWRQSLCFRLVGRVLGKQIYRLLALAGLRREKRRAHQGGLRLRVEFAGEQISANALALFIGNEATLGGDFVPCPQARTDDGKLDFCLVSHDAETDYLDLFRDVARGEHLNRDMVSYRQGSSPLRLEFESAASIMVDGDVWRSAAVFEFEVLAGRFSVVVS